MEPNIEQKNLLKTLKKYEIVKLLSNLNDTGNRNVYFEQYSTDIDIVVDILYTAISDIYGKVVADLGCGNGIFSIGASLMNAKKVYCVEITDSIKIAIENAIKLNVKNIEYHQIDVEKFNINVDTTIMNPPFGYQNPGLDMKFFKTAMDISNSIYFIYTSKGEYHIKNVFKNYEKKDFRLFRIKNYKLKIPYYYKFHKKDKEYIDISLYMAKVI